MGQRCITIIQRTNRNYLPLKYKFYLFYFNKNSSDHFRHVDILTIPLLILPLIVHALQKYGLYSRHKVAFFSFIYE